MGVICSATHISVCVVSVVSHLTRRSQLSRDS